MKIRIACAALFLAAFHAPAALAQIDGAIVAPFVTTPPDVVERMLSIANTGPADYVVDLGSGDGRIVIAAAKEFGARGLGLELDPKLVQLSRGNAQAAGVAGRTEFRVEDVLRADFSQADVVTVYLLPGLMAQLAPLFLDKLKPGSRVVTHAFVFPSWKPDKAEKVKLAVPHPSQGDISTIFMWVIPANARGQWRAASREGEWRIKVDQNFQEIEVEGEGGGAKLAVAEARLQGARIQFSGTLRGAPFSFGGRIENDRIAGDAVLQDGPAKRNLPLVFSK
jgi:protein-L-isoaspartate O-methyltransferase